MDWIPRFPQSRAKINKMRRSLCVALRILLLPVVLLFSLITRNNELVSIAEEASPFHYTALQCCHLIYVKRILYIKQNGCRFLICNNAKRRSIRAVVYINIYLP